MFPSIRYFWPSYLIISLALLLLILFGIPVVRNFSETQVLDNASVLYCGVWIAFLSLASSSWIQWRSSSVQHAVSALQALRTDREYLICAGVIKSEFPKLDTPMSDQQMAELLASKTSKDIEMPSFADASYFVLNQYEFLGAAAKRGAMDRGILRETINSVMCGLVLVYAPAIRHLRAQNPKTYSNLIWLYEDFTGEKFE